MFDDANEVFEFLRGGLPYYVIVFLPILIIMSPVNPVNGAHEFAVYRMQQFDLQGNTRGCRNSLVNVEARTLEAGSYTRRCILAPLAELTPSKYRDVVSQGAGGLLVMVPANLSQMTEESRQSVLDIERIMLAEETTVPVYFATETPELLEIYHGIRHSANGDQSTTAVEALLASLTSTGFQMVASAAQAKPMPDVQVANIQGKLSGYGVEEQLPTIALVAHYDSFAIAPTLSFGADSNGSGVAALLELARLFSRLYSNSRTHGRVNLLFLLSGAGKFNYQGTKKWIEDNLDSTESSLLQDSAYTLCLDTLGQGSGLYLHVSKPPKDGSSGALLMQELKNVAHQFYPEVQFDMVHKKINLAEETLAWEHERFSIRRLPAFTISRLESPRDLQRNSLLDTRDRMSTKTLARNVKVIAEALARHIYNLTNLPEVEVFTGSMAVREDHMSAWIDHLALQPRAAQLLADSTKNALVSSLEQTLSQYLKEVRTTVTKPDKRDPEFTFYDAVSSTMTAYSVKPAAFDLVLMAAVSVYLCVLYLLIQVFPQFYWMLHSFGAKAKQS